MYYDSFHGFLTVILDIPGNARFTTPLAPLLGTFLPFLSLDTVLATNPKAFFGVLIIPFLPYEVDFFIAFIALLTAVLYVLLRLLGILCVGNTPIGRTGPTTGRSMNCSGFCCIKS